MCVFFWHDVVFPFSFWLFWTHGVFLRQRYWRISQTGDGDFLLLFSPENCRLSTVNRQGQLFCFTDEDTEGQRRKETCPRSHRLDFGQFVYPLWVLPSLSVNRDGVLFTTWTNRKARESRSFFNNYTVFSKSKGPWNTLLDEVKMNRIYLLFSSAFCFFSLLYTSVIATQRWNLEQMQEDLWACCELGSPRIQWNKAGGFRGRL